MFHVVRMEILELHLSVYAQKGGHKYEKSHQKESIELEVPFC